MGHVYHLCRLQRRRKYLAFASRERLHLASWCCLSEEQKNPLNTLERLISLGKNKTKEDHLITFKYFLANAWGNSSIPPWQTKLLCVGER